MWICRRDGIVRVWAPAKVNLFLEVMGRRPDGYHDLATLMVTVGLFDSLEFRESHSTEVRLHCEQSGLSTGDDNLVCRAAKLLRDRLGIRSGVDIRLTKRIPMQAGLAGGSSDAAATLAGLDRLWRLGLSRQQLGALGAELGSDVTFFFHGPAAWCTGRGEIVEPVRLGRPLDFVLSWPSVGLATAAVFKALQLTGPFREGREIRRAVESGDIGGLGKNLYNRLEEPAMRLCPEVAQLHRRMAEQGAEGVRMSGSGSTVFALVGDAADAWRLSRALAHGQDVVGPARVRVVRSCD